jgi:ubiquinone/menaquinone biosynthesis C-methylase UbiE
MPTNFRDRPDDQIIERLTEPVLRCARGVTPANVALAQLFMAAPSAEDAKRTLDQAVDRCNRNESHDDLRRLNRMRELWDQTPDAFATVKAVMRTHDQLSDPHPSPEMWAAAFDSAAEMSPEASVALYSLGRADLLRAETEEIVQRMRSWNLLTPTSSILDIGCGTGRIVEAVSPHVGIAIGIDISMRMLRFARDRCSAANVGFLRTSGRDLSAFPDGCFDLVCAVDVFPYFVISGLARHHLGEAARVLRRAGHLLILNFSYGDSPTASASILQHLAHEIGLSIRHGTAQEFSLWDGTCFLLKKSGA